jgi:tRNA (cytidine32/uridine32-2'-O)-methyltransferase
VSSLDNVRIVLVNTSHPGNIGAVARAMKNMGLSQLYLVAPKKFPHEEAVWRASNALDVLDGAVVVDSLEQAVADCGMVVGTSARERRIPWPLVNPRVCAETVYPELASHPVALVFGREDRGLTNEELHSCNMHVHIPTNPEYSSLNLGMAVQVLSYEMRMRHLNDELSDDPMAEWDEKLANQQQVAGMLEHLEQTLIDIEFLNPKAPKQLMTRLTRLFRRARMDEMELNIMRGVLRAAQGWVQKARGGQ